MRQPSEMARLVVAYTALRLALFAVVFIGLLFTPLPKIVSVAVALVASALLSYPLGRQQRDRVGALYLERRARKARR